jgi:LysR family transcriptional activator of nhaA
MALQKNRLPKWINYNHLYYFWVVAREGSMVRAAEELLVSQPTISCQIRELEEMFGKKLFDRTGKGLALTDAGRVVFNYARDIFTLGQEMLNTMEHEQTQPVRLAVGIVDVIPKTVARLLLEPALRLEQPVRLICREDKSDRLLLDLAARRLDIVLSDAPIGTAVEVQGFSHLLGECGVTFFAAPATAAKARRKFPQSLNGAAMLLPADTTTMRRSLNVWFAARKISPLVVGEFDDGATLAAFGRADFGIFPVPSIVEDEVRQELGVAVVGRAETVRERYYAISVEAKLQHPAVVAVCDAARHELFGDGKRV